MPILKPTEFVVFNVNNPEHVRSIVEIETSNKRTTKFNFDFPHPFPNGIAYAKHLMFLAWANQMGVRPENIHDKHPTTAGLPTSDPDRKLVTIGLRAAALQSIATRGLPPGQHNCESRIATRTG